MIIVCGGVKGGVGKTTLAVNLAILRAAEQRDVLLIDADEQGTASDFTDVRVRAALAPEAEYPVYTCVRLRDAAVREQALRLKRKYDDIVIDVGGRDTASQRAAISVANKLVVPFLPRSFDLWTLDRVHELVALMQPVNPKLKVQILLNRVDARGADNQEARELLTAEKRKDFELLGPMLGSRKSFANAASEGKGIAEYRPADEKAIAEMKAVYKVIFV